MYYRQCKLQNKQTFLHSFIPERYAHLHKRLRLKDEEGWIVVEVGSRVHEDLVKELERDHLHQREASDI